MNNSTRGALWGWLISAFQLFSFSALVGLGVGTAEGQERPGGGGAGTLPPGVVTNTPYPIPFILYTNGWPWSVYLSNGPVADAYVNGIYLLQFTTDTNNVVYTNTGNRVETLIYTNDPNNGPGFLVNSNATWDLYDNAIADTIQLNGEVWEYGFGSPLQGTPIPAMTGATNYNGTNYSKLVVADYFQGDGTLLTGPPALTYGAFTNNVVITCSSKGIANGLSVLTNDGAMFGPDTPETTTCGFNEACGKYGCGTIVLSAGVFDLYATAYAGRCHVIGAGQFNTNASNLGTVLRCHSPIVGASCHFEHCTFAGDNNGITYLTVGEGNPLSYGEGIVEHCYFAPWGFLTNVLSLGTGASINPINDTGLQMGYSYGSDFAVGNNFDFLALGIMITGDHGMVIGNQFLDNLYATNAYSTNNLLSQCPSIAISYSSGERQDYTFQHNVFVNQHVGYAVINNGNAGLYNGLYSQKWTSYDDNFEGNGIPCVLATNANVRWVFQSPNQFLNTASTNSYVSPPGSWNGRMVTNLMTIINPEETGDPKVFGNWLVTGTNAAGYVVGNGSGLTNLSANASYFTNTGTISLANGVLALNTNSFVGGGTTYTNTSDAAGFISGKGIGTNVLLGQLPSSVLTNAAAFQATNNNLTTLATLNGSGLTNLSAANLVAGNTTLSNNWVGTFTGTGSGLTGVPNLVPGMNFPFSGTAGTPGSIYYLLYNYASGNNSQNANLGPLYPGTYTNNTFYYIYGNILATTNVYVVVQTNVNNGTWGSVYSLTMQGQGSGLGNYYATNDAGAFTIPNNGNAYTFRIIFTNNSAGTIPSISGGFINKLLIPNR